MTLKEELEILRGEPIQVFTGDPMDIPCIETSDPVRLCKHPVVSVHMITYNHEPYIRKAIEGVMMQKTDFEFELVIGEDCSTDKTREICFEYQKRYPDKIRVLWCDHNLYQTPHPAGENGRRNLAHCRGEFIAFCEGDDCWISPDKLQRQVEIMRNNPSVGACFADAMQFVNNQEVAPSVDVYKGLNPGLVEKDDFFDWILARSARNCMGLSAKANYVYTCSSLIRASVWRGACQNFDIFDWRLHIGDTTTWLGVSALADVYYMNSAVARYTINPHGACKTNGGNVVKDGWVVRLYFALKCGLPSDTIVLCRNALGLTLADRLYGLPKEKVRHEAARLLKINVFRLALKKRYNVFWFNLLTTRALPVSLVLFVRRRVCSVAVRMKNLLGIGHD